LINAATGVLSLADSQFMPLLEVQIAPGNVFPIDI